MKTILTLILIILAIAALIVICTAFDAIKAAQSQPPSNDHLTETYGATEFHLQLTALADEEQ